MTPASPQYRGPASDWQVRFVEQAVDGECNHHLLVALRMVGHIDHEALQQALTDLVERHEALRTTLTVIGAQVEQLVWAPAPPSLDWIELTSPEDLHATLVRIADKSARLDGGALLSVTVIRLRATEHVVALTVHHVVADGWSLELLSAELQVLYAERAKARVPTMAAPRAQFRDYVMHEQMSANPRHVAFWRERLVGRQLPAVRRIAMPTRRARTWMLEAGPLVPTSTTEALAALVRREKTSYAVGLVAAVASTFHGYGATEVTIGVIHANRLRPEFNGVVGPVADLLPLRIDLSGDPSYRELLDRVRSEWLAALSHHLPFSRVMSTSSGENERPTCDVLVNYLPPVPVAAAAAERLPVCVEITPVYLGWQHRRIRVGRSTAIAPLSCMLLDGIGGTMQAVVGAQTGTASRELVTAHAEDLVSCLRTVVAQPGRTLDQALGPPGLQADLLAI